MFEALCLNRQDTLATALFRQGAVKKYMTDMVQVELEKSERTPFLRFVQAKIDAPLPEPAAEPAAEPMGVLGVITGIFM